MDIVRIAFAFVLVSMVAGAGIWFIVWVLKKVFHLEDK